MRARRVSRPTFSALMTKLPVPLSVAPVTGSPGDFSTGIGSPVTIDSSTVLVPSRTTPSTGTFSPGRTRRRSPGLHVLEGHVGLGPVVSHPAGGLRRQAEKGPDGPAGALAGPKLQHLSHEDEGDDHRRRLEVAAHLAVGLARKDAGNTPGSSTAATL